MPPGLTDIQRLMNLSVLLVVLGPQEQLDEVIKEMDQLSEGRPTRPMVASHIRNLHSSRALHLDQQ